MWFSWVFFSFFRFVAFNVITRGNSSWEKSMWWVTLQQTPVSNLQSWTSVKQSFSSKIGIKINAVWHLLNFIGLKSWKLLGQKRKNVGHMETAQHEMNTVARMCPLHSKNQQHYKIFWNYDMLKLLKLHLSIFLILINLLLFISSYAYIWVKILKLNNLWISRLYSSLSCVYSQQHIIKIQTFHVTFLHSPCPLWPPRPWFCHALFGMQSLPVVFQEFLPSRLL